MATTNQAGTVIDRTSYEPYGKAIGETLDGVGYTGHVMDPVSGLVYMQQRYYDPVIGRFLSVDPVSTDAIRGFNFNRYWYGNNNPYRFTDPDGRLACTGAVPKSDCIRPASPWGDGRKPSFEAEGGDTDPVADYESEKKAARVRGVETFTAAGKTVAKEAAFMVAGGPIGKLLGKIGRALGIAKTVGKIEFKANHALRRFPEWEHNEIANGVTAHISKRGAPATGEAIQETIMINGKQYSYRAFGEPGGSTSVGSIVEGTFSRNIAEPRL